MRPRSMDAHTSLLANALRRLSVRFVLLQLLLGLAVGALFVLWLRIPDASALDVVGTVLVGCLLLALAGGGEAGLLLGLTGQPLLRPKLVRGAVLLLAIAVLWFAVHVGLNALDDKSSLYAGYLNSRLPASLRSFFSYPHLYRWMGWATNLLSASVAGLLLLLAGSLLLARRPRVTVARGLRSGWWWLCVLVGIGLAVLVTAHLAAWVPGHALGAELVGLLLRLSTVVIWDALTATMILAMLAEVVQHADGGYPTPEGIPVLSQPRTDPSP